MNSPSLPLLFVIPKGMTICLIPRFMTLSLPSFAKRENGMQTYTFLFTLPKTVNGQNLKFLTALIQTAVPKQFF